tara:strand:+ start:55 stop:777 length:723 start_codon:yes stop_codon:yes gene_type:complete
MNIIIIGYGKMGKEIEKICLEKKYTILFKINSKNSNKLTKSILEQCDVAIDFSNSEKVIDTILLFFKNKIPVVSGSTDWINVLNKIKDKCIEYNSAFLHSPNFSIGMNIFFQLNKTLAKKMNHLNEYKVSIDETHHLNKKDKPSGTAIKLANDIINNINRIDKWSFDENLKKQVAISSKRKGDYKGIHQINFSSNIDSITINHTAHSREGFAKGAILAAEFIKNKKGIFTLDDIINKIND